MLVLTALSTVGARDRGDPGTGLHRVAIVTVLGGLESYFNWRALWALMDETQYRHNRERDRMDYLVTTHAEQVSADRLREFFDQQQEIWNDVSHRWIEFRELDRTPREHYPSNDL